MKSALYAGTFDPLTLGHFDLIERAAEIFDHLVLAVAVSEEKKPLFALPERLALAKRVVRGMGNVEVTTFDGLLVDFARHQGIHILIRGLRAYSDFEYEFMMALTNRKLAPEIETLFMMPKEIHSYVSSSTVREVARFGGDTSEFVPPVVQRAITRKIASLKLEEGRPVHPRGSR
jgi:pantetheine-phosphate adenylyltransferase